MVNYGGQAVIEGVMMRGSQAMAVAVRDPHGAIVVHEEPLNAALYRGRLGRWPLLRGLTLLWDALGLGMRSLMFSANVASNAPDGAVPAGDVVVLEGPIAWGTMALGMGLGVGLFILVPKLLAALIESLAGTWWVGLVVEGVLRIGVFIAYLWAIGRIPEIQRVFAYHGAEHKTINAYEAGAPLTVEGVQPFSTAHARCGTAFLLTLVVLSMVVFAPLAHLPLAVGLVTRVLLIPVLAMLAYEFIRFSASHAEWAWMRAVIKPNLALQRLTTREPDAAMIQVALAALQRVLEREGKL